MVHFFVFKKTNTQREPAIPADVSISKSALYSRIGASDAESTTALLYPQQDLDSALRLARAEVTLSTTWERKNLPFVFPFLPVLSQMFYVVVTCSVPGTVLSHAKAKGATLQVLLVLYLWKADMVYK